MFLYLNYCDYEERFILHNGDVNDFSYNFAFNTPTRLYTFNINLLLTGETNGKPKYLTGNFNKPHFEPDEIYQTTHNYILGSKLQFTIPFLYLLKRYSSV